MLGLQLSSFPPAKSRKASRPGQMQVNWTWLPFSQNTYPPYPLMGAPCTAFPDVLAGLREHGWMLKGPTSYKSWDFADKYTYGSKRLPLVCITHPSAKKDEHNQRSERLHVIAETTRPHTDWYSGCYKINCISPGTKLEMTQRAINAEICLDPAKISDKKPVRQFLPYVLEWIF